MTTKFTTRNNLEIAILEPRGAIIGGEETDQLKLQASDLLEQGNRKLIVDLGSVTYMNSSGLGAVVGIQSMYKELGGRMKVCGLDKGVKNVFILTSLTRVIDVTDTRDIAIAQFETI